MQWLTLVPEDAGTQRLKADNRRPAATPDVDAVAPYPQVHSARLGDRPEQASRAPTRDRRRNQDRRQGDRRQKQVPVILDTRSKHDRRALENRRTTGHDAALRPHPVRVDLYA